MISHQYQALELPKKILSTTWKFHIFTGILLNFVNPTLAFALNLPKFCPTAAWDRTAITFADQLVVGGYPAAMFINTNNTIYVVHRQRRQILIWDENSTMPTKMISGNFSDSPSIFVTQNGDIYINNAAEHERVQRWISKNETFTTVMNMNSSCYGLFVDVNDSLYCSINDEHVVVKKSLHDLEMKPIPVAGIGTPGSASDELSKPGGIFVDVNFDLYVTDCVNDRIQLFPLRESNGITVVGGNLSSRTILLDCPRAVILDAQKYLFIVDRLNHRIIGEGLYGFRCLVGCYGLGSQSNQLVRPFALSFDRSGNIFVGDTGNSRIQKFLFQDSSCVNSSNQLKLCPTATWDRTAITFANESVVGRYPTTMFINTNNTIYVVHRQRRQILIWNENSTMPTKIISGNFSNPSSIFVTQNGDIYINDNTKKDRIQKWIAKNETFVTVMNFRSNCYSLFVDVNDSLYCSMNKEHEVVKKSLHDLEMKPISVAGMGVPGSASDKLNTPGGIFVDVNFDLYVTDCVNDRIQLFPLRESNGITVVGGNLSSRTILLDCPRAVILDAQKYLFIVDRLNHRIIGEGLYGFRCLVGCYGLGWQSNQLLYSIGFSFDRFGNIFIRDYENHLIQKFLFIESSCDIVPNQPKFCSTAIWRRDGFTFANETILGSQPRTMAIDAKDSVYSIHSERNELLIWRNNNYDSIESFSSNFSNPASIFVTMNDAVYIDNGNSNRQVQKWMLKANKSSIAMHVPSSCWQLFIDPLDNIYCSLFEYHQVIKRPLHNDQMATSIVAGSNRKGSAPNTLDHPKGIFVEVKFNLYVADCGNNRIQLFVPRESDDTSSITNMPYQSSMTFTSQMYFRRCNFEKFYYEAFEISVSETYYYTIYSSSNTNTNLYGCIYENNFNPLAPYENLLAQNDDISKTNRQFKLRIPLYVNTTYILIVTTSSPEDNGEFTFSFLGLKDINIKHQTTLANIQQEYSSEFTFNTAMFYRDCRIPKCYYESLEINVITTGIYVLWSESHIHIYGYIYENDFDPLKTSDYLRFEHDGTFVTTYYPYTMGKFSIFISGPNNISLNRFSPKFSSCIVGDQCNFYVKSIGLTLDDILHDELRSNKPLNDQSISIKFSAVLTIIMFIAGLINSFFSFLTFKSKDVQQVGCGLYLLASSVTSLLTITMFAIKFGFLVITRMNVSMISLSVFQKGCKFIELMLKVFLYSDNWLNGCVAIERAFHIYKGININKKKSKRIARWIILILPFFIMGTFTHELIFRKAFEYPSEISRNESNQTFMNRTNEGISYRPIQCITEYPHSVQYYNTFILFFHLIVPFIANLCSALIIIFGAARQRSKAQKGKQKYIDHVRAQLIEHKQLIISPILLLTLSSPRLVIASLPGCVKISEYLWLYLLGYFISFTPSVLVFIIFVFPSKLYMKTFKQSLNIERWRIHR
ncbi:hypothetical protein I4U23_016682 [Adineta vaga]|nr:hypothetical protein I4U23_016682 [Adineta vaga]